MDNLSVSREPIYLTPASNIQIQFEKRIIEENIEFKRDDTLRWQRTFIKYTFYEKDMAFVNQILAELKGEKIQNEEITGQNFLTVKTLKKIGIAFLAIIALIIIFWNMIRELLFSI
jgi:hypothetical protein